MLGNGTSRSSHHLYGKHGNAQADAGFDRAAAYISSQFTDDVTITIQRGFASLGGGILGQAGSTTTVQSYSNFRTRMLADVTSADDTIMTNNLPTGTTYSAYLNRTLQNGNSATPYVDNNGSQNNTQVEITTANARALGFNIAAGVDASITFSSNFTWDFDNSNGISAGAQDFVGVATHELMHAMGFVSVVDDVDFNPGLNENSVRAASLDFTRHSGLSVANGANMDLTADNRIKYFSIDGGVTNLTPTIGGGFSTGVTFGDGSQASHWKDNQNLGIMDPTARPAGQLNVVSQLDLLALDVIGWNRITAVPEPSSIALLFVSGVAALGTYRRKTKKDLGRKP